MLKQNYSGIIQNSSKIGSPYTHQNVIEKINYFTKIPYFSHKLTLFFYFLFKDIKIHKTQDI